MPVFQYEAMDATGQEIKDVVEAANEQEAQVGQGATDIRSAKERPTDCRNHESREYLDRTRGPGIQGAAP